ncbi:hypothetical protein Pyn_16427 [Prunus yedoensis var. nudiflora]|nr:hypothetical protein Pyn_16427 [Prunus yedoensis var. nudiflora]
MVGIGKRDEGHGIKKEKKKKHGVSKNFGMGGVGKRIVPQPHVDGWVLRVFAVPVDG